MRGDDRGHRRDDEERPQHRARRQKEERIRRGGRIAQDERALPEIVQEQRGEDETEPGQPNRSLAEVAHVRVQRFSSRDREHDRAEDEEPGLAVDDEELDAVPRIQRE